MTPDDTHEPTAQHLSALTEGTMLAALWPVEGMIEVARVVRHNGVRYARYVAGTDPPDKYTINAVPFPIWGNGDGGVLVTCIGAPGTPLHTRIEALAAFVELGAGVTVERAWRVLGELTP